MSSLIFKDPQNPTTGNAVTIDSGNLNIYNEINGVRRLTSTLNRIETGSASLNAWTTIGGYWQEAPQVVLSPKNLPVFFAQYSTGRQRFTLTPIVENVSNGIYKIYPSIVYTVDGANESAFPNYLDQVATSEFGSYYNGKPPLVNLCTPFYPFAGGSLSINYSYNLTVHHSYDDWSTNTKIYIDYSRGVSYSSALLENRTAWYKDPEQTRTVTPSIGSAACMWRLRMVGAFVDSKHVSNLHYYDSYYLRLNSYSFTFPATNISTSGEVYYLAIGR